MKRTIIVCGYGPGISHAVAKRFGREGLAVALAARSAEKLGKAAEELSSAGITAKAFPTDLASADATRELVRAARSALGPIEVVHYNAYRGGAGDLLSASADDLRGVIDVAVTGLVAATQEAHADLKANKGALLVTGGGLCHYDANVDKMAVSWGAMGLAISKAAQHKAVVLLAARLADDGIHVGEVIVQGIVKGTDFDRGNGTLEPDAIAERFFELYRDRKATSVTFP